MYYLTQQNYFQINGFAQRKPPSPVQSCFLRMLRDPAFFWRPNNTASRGRGGGKNRSATKFRKNAPQVCNFLNSFVQDCIYGDSRFLARIVTWTKRKPTNKKHFTEAVLSTKFHGTPSSHRKVRPHIRFLLHPLKTVRFCSSRRTRAHCYMFSCCSNIEGLESVESDL